MQSGGSKGTAYVQYQNLRGAQMALDAMNGFELANRFSELMAELGFRLSLTRPVRVQPIVERSQMSEHLEDSGHGPKLDHKARQSLMQKLARTEAEPGAGPPPPPKIIP